MHNTSFSLNRLVVLFLAMAAGALTSMAAVQTLTVNVQGGGAVTRNPDLPSYPKGAVVVLTAVAEEGWKFSSWSGDAQGTENPLNVAMSQDKVILATFERRASYHLTVSVEGGLGSVNPSSGDYLENTQLLLQATPQAGGWLFQGWGGDLQGNQNPIPYTVRSNSTISARFVLPPGFSLQPESQQAPVGGRASFLAGPSGTGPFTFQWYLNGSPLPGATQADLGIEPVKATDAGDYFVIVTSPYGSATSRTVRLSVTADCSSDEAIKVCDEATLRSAVARGGLIQFCCNGTIRLSQTLVITKDVSLDARDRAVALDGQGVVRLIHVMNGVRFAATNVNFGQGFAQGTPGVDGGGPGGVPMDPAPVPGGEGRGGAIYNQGGDIILVQCVFSKNRVQGGLGPVDAPGIPPREGARAGHGLGGAICNEGGTLLILACSFASNSSRDGDNSALARGETGFRGGLSHGGAIFSRGGGKVQIRQSLFSLNRAFAHPAPGSVARGGAIYLEDGELELTETRFEGCAATGEPNDFLIPGLAPADAEGGAIFVRSGRVSVLRGVFSNNRAVGTTGSRHARPGGGRGGAILSQGDCSIVETLFSNNDGVGGGLSSANADGQGGGLFNSGKAIVIASTFYRNRAIGGDAGAFGDLQPLWVPGNAAGGGIYNQGELSMTNSTIASNKTVGGARASRSVRSGNALGGGIFNGGGVAHLSCVTLASNEDVSSQGDDSDNFPGDTRGANVHQATGTFLLRNSLVAYGGTNGNAYGKLTDGGYNMSSDGSCEFASGTSFNFTDPLLLPLSYNGGVTPTLALNPDSPAIDFGAVDGLPSVDQRGQPRPSGGRADIGAYEQVLSRAPRLSITIKPPQVEIRFLGDSAVSYALYRSTDLIEWTLVNSVLSRQPDGTVVANLDHSPNGQQFYKVVSAP